MKVIETPNNEAAAADAYWESLAATLPVQTVYNEMAEFPVTEIDALEQLRANLETLADMQARLSFVMREVKYLLKA